MRVTTWDESSAREIIAARQSLEGACIPILHALQGEFGHIPPDSIPLIAEALNISRAEVHGVMTFYHDFTVTPGARRTIRLCRAEACQACGCEDLVSHAAEAHGLEVDGEAHGLEVAGDVALKTVYCLGNCALGPAALVDGALIGRVDAAKLSALIAGAPAATVQGESGT